MGKNSNHFWVILSLVVVGIWGGLLLGTWGHESIREQERSVQFQKHSRLQLEFQNKLRKLSLQAANFSENLIGNVGEDFFNQFSWFAVCFNLPW